MKKLLLAIAMVLTVAVISGCSNASGEEKEVLKVALLPDESPAKIIEDNQKLKTYLEESLAMEVDLVVTTDYSSMIESMRNGHIDLGYFGPLSYVLLKTKMDEVEPFAAKLEDGEPTYHSVFVANADSGIETLEDVKGHTIAWGDPSSTSSHMIPKEMLQAAGVSPEDYTEEFTGGHDAVATAVQNGHAQAGGLSKPIYDSLIEEGVMDPNKVIELQLSDAYPNYPWAVRTDLDSELQEKIKQAFYDLEDEDILKSLDAEGFAPMTDEDYDIIRDMVDLLGLDVEDM
ncbi:phosphate/phosphite/phosphonate ABC transporter substrate-binding protein [Oceanobacillus damuensis]|uniref:phosphate/phosphite/phosphonate ABC transporter substrate-binding protein n=1 Tax=Oceanobacillus damuensis TaxID=937928 RepID=UPI00082A5448|nr:phosphate/phosphite/phosphonate ABC transporter substrate-binding protein [Oceanobacillus damuensis]